MMETDTVSSYGFTAVAASAATVKSQKDSSISKAPFVSASSTPAPDTNLARRIRDYAKASLIVPTFHHSMRVYHYGLAIARVYFPEWNLVPGSALEETYFLICMLHDIGTTDTHLEETKMSFEFHGAWIAFQELISPKHAVPAPRPQAESVAEAIIRHQEIRETGRITLLGQLIQLATTFDNVGLHPELVSKETIEDVVKSWPRMKWNGCFASTIRKENRLKPWSHSTTLGEDDFPDSSEKNELMKPYD